MLPNERGTAPAFTSRRTVNTSGCSGRAARAGVDGGGLSVPWLTSIRRTVTVPACAEDCRDDGVRRRREAEAYYAEHRSRLTILATSGQTELHLAEDGVEAEALR